MVEWKTIEELGSFFGGLTGKTKNDFVDGNANFITYMNVFSNPSLNTSKVGTVKINEGEKQNKIQKGDILFTGSSETPEETGMSCVVTDDLKEDFYMNSFCFGLRLYSPEQVNLHYLKHILRSEPVRKSIAKTASGVTRYNISKARFSKIKLPIPSLSEQSRIVSILDTFTSSISNLKQQIEERRKQYEYERDLLLDLEGKEGVEMKKLGECVLFITDGDHQPPPKSSEGIPFVTISDIEKLSHTIDFSNTFFVPQEYYNSLKSDKKAKKGDVLYTVTGSFGIPVLIEDNREFCFQRHIALIRPNNTIALSRYIYHWLCSNYAKKQGEEKASGGAQKTVSLNSLRSFRFYYPPLQAQSRIVSILDTFEQSISNLEEQLAMREKQYEYYRNQLLTFEGEEERGKT